MKHLFQSWCDLCYQPLILGNYEEINGKLICDKCNPNKPIEKVYVCIPKDKE